MSEDKDEIKIDLDKFKEIPHSYIIKLSGDKLLTIDVMGQDGEIVFKAGHSITEKEVKELIEQGKKFFVPKIVVQTGTYEHEIISQETLKDLAEKTVKNYTNIRNTGKMTYQQYLDSHQDLASIVQGLRQEDKHGGVLSILKDVEDFDYYTYTHSVNVGILTMILSYKLGYTKENIKNITTGGYLHDIGKLRIPIDIIEKSGPLNSEEYHHMMEHTRNGYRIMDSIVDGSGNKVVPNLVKLIVLFHHRKYRIRGYPFREQRDKRSEDFYKNLPEEVRYIGICDIYDAITTNTPYRKGITPAKALQHILNLSSYYFSTEDVHRFLRAMVLSLNKGNGFLNKENFVVLESLKSVRGEKDRKTYVYEFARILKTFKGRPTEPAVRIFYDATENKKIRPIEVDLRHDHMRKVVRVLESNRLHEMLLNMYK